MSAFRHGHATHPQWSMAMEIALTQAMGREGPIGGGFASGLGLLYVTDAFAPHLGELLAALRATFAEYGIPVTVDLPARGQVGNPDFYRARQFLGKSMVELVSCGSTMTGPNAATYRIYMSLVATVRAQPAGGSTVGLLFTASARDIAGGTSVDRLPCGSTGLLENRFLDRVVATLGAG